MKEHFIIAGFQRCGTSYLAKALDLHPQIEMAKPIFPEPKYFLNKELSLEEYSKAYFIEDTRARGDKSTSYSDQLGIAEKIKTIVPRAKVILCLRDPVFRAISNYHFSKMNGFETRAIEEVFCETPIAAPAADPKYFRYLERGNYLPVVNEFREHFGGQLILVSYEKMASKTSKVLSEILEFIGVENETELALTFNRSEHNISQEVISFLKDYYSNTSKGLSDIVDVDMDDWL